MKVPPLIPSWLLLATVAVFALALCMSGCASMDYQWRQVRAPSEKPWVYVDAVDVDTACRGLGAMAAMAMRITGCAQWHPSGCLIVLPEGAPEWLREHEERHCEGWTHE